jgi:hypothetical protein
LTAIHGTAPDNVWAVGADPWTSLDVVLHWDGTSWTEMKPGTHINLRAVWVSGKSDVWIAGAPVLFGSGGISHWDGRAWTTSVAAGAMLSPTKFFGLTPQDLWLVGDRTLQHWDGASWKDELSRTMLMDDVMLTGIWGGSASDIWAIGYGGEAYHFDGTAWTAQNPPIPESGSDGFHPGPEALWGSRASDIWAVGREGILLHWDGGRWSRWGSGLNIGVTAVWAAGPRDAWAVGAAVDPPAGLALHWNGQAWSKYNLTLAGLTDTGEFSLSSIFGISANDVYAVDQHGTIIHFDGSTWSIVRNFGPPFTDILQAVWASGPNDVWVAGSPTLHWDGRAWSEVALPSPRFALPPSSVWGTAANDLWMVGDSHLAGQRPILLHYDGSSWSDQASALDQKIGLGGVWGAGKDDVYVVGGDVYGGQLASAIFHFDGQTWTRVEHGTVNRWLRAVWGTAANDIWAIGDAGAIVHFDGSSWAAEESGDSSSLTGVWGVGTDVWIVGGASILHHTNH